MSAVFCILLSSCGGSPDGQAATSASETPETTAVFSEPVITEVSTAPEETTSAEVTELTLPEIASVPDEKINDGHWALSDKNKGSCRELKGNVELVFIFLSEGDSFWSALDIAAFRTELNGYSNKLTGNAEKYGVRLNLSSTFRRGRISQTVDMSGSGGWYSNALKSAGYYNTSALFSSGGNHETAVIFLINRDGRSYAHETPDGLEYAVVYKVDPDFRHELFHLFGAVDMYMNQTIIDAADEYFPDSVMKDPNSEVVDSLTAYLIGWTSKPDADAEAFLRATASVTANNLVEDFKKSTFTGYSTKEYSTGTYKGYLVEGVPEGKGVMVWNTGGSYDGEWKYGKFDGKGIYVWPGGETYDGEWKDGEMTGHGTYTDADGNVSEGEWRDGKLVFRTFRIGR